MNKITSLIMATSLSLAACESGVNPLICKQFDTPYNLPPFGQWNYSDFVPAIDVELAKIDECIALITTNRNAPTFENTIMPFDRRNERLNVLESIVLNLRESDACDSINIVAEEILPKLTEADDDVYMNAALFERIKNVYENRHESGLDSAQIRVTELYYRDFVRHGALLNEVDQAKLRDYNQQLSLLSLQFSNNLLAETNDFKLVIDTVLDLKGLPENVVAAAAERAKSQGLEGKWLFTTQKAEMIPFLQYAENQSLRKTLYDAYCARGNNGNANDNKEIVLKMTSIRAKRAALLGYKSHAHYVIEENMAATPEAVDTFLMDLWDSALRKAKQELQELRIYAGRINWANRVEASDWWYWSERLRKAKYDLDENEISAYLSLDNVLSGLFDVANRLYNIKLTKVDDAPLYNASDNVVYRVDDADGQYIGVVYFDFHPRASKGAGAWCTTFQEPIDQADGTRTMPQISIVCNVASPTSDTQSLINFDDAETISHEFGHALHTLFTRGKYRRTAGVVPRDYVEMPSQFMEHWVKEPDVLRSFARHFQTGEVMPDALVERIQNAATFNQGFMTVEYLAAAILDLKWHMISADENITDVDEFERKVLDEIGLIPEIAPRYRTTYFAHSFNFDYSAAYYVYVWSELLDCDAYSVFKTSGDIFSAEIAARFRQECLAEAGNSDPMTQYVKFRGQRPNIDWLLLQRGLKK